MNFSMLTKGDKFYGCVELWVPGTTGRHLSPTYRWQ